VIRNGRVRSLAEAAAARGVTTADVVKTLVVRRGDDDFLVVLVPGDRAISWPKLQANLGVNRLSMPDAEVAKQATGYERGTITPFGSARLWPTSQNSRTSASQESGTPVAPARPGPSGSARSGPLGPVPRIA
jgi:Cys-tRNA(Pro)/Cys-tRNA(Cys) deacylase